MPENPEGRLRKPSERHAAHRRLTGRRVRWRRGEIGLPAEENRPDFASAMTRFCRDAKNRSLCGQKLRKSGLLEALEGGKPASIKTRLQETPGRGAAA